MMKQIQWFIFLFLLMRVCYAQPIVCQIKSGGILDNIVNQFGNVALVWQVQINPIAKKIFFTLFGMEFMWQLMIKKVFAGDIEKLWVFFFTRSVLCFFFAKYLVNIKLYEGIILYISHLGSSLSGFSLNINSNNSFPILGPSEVISSFSCVADSIHQLTDTTGALQFITTKFSLAIMQVMLFVVLTFIAYCLMKVIVQAYFLIYAGFMLTGFAGSSWTMNFWQRYLQSVSAIAIKFFAVCLIMGVLITKMHQWSIAINQAQNAVDLAAIILQVLGSAIIIALVAYQLPEWAATALAGQIHLERSMSAVSNFMSGIGSNHTILASSQINSAINATNHSSGGTGNSLVNDMLQDGTGMVTNGIDANKIFQLASKDDLQNNFKEVLPANKLTGSSEFANIVAMNSKPPNTY
jgi:P-type conjugative transfer protein TrbL